MNYQRIVAKLITAVICIGRRLYPHLQECFPPKSSFFGNNDFGGQSDGYANDVTTNACSLDFKGSRWTSLRLCGCVLVIISIFKSVYLVDSFDKVLNISGLKFHPNSLASPFYFICR